jgi:hypothetical protein
VEFVVLQVNVWFLSCRVARIKYSTFACVQEAIPYMFLSFGMSCWVDFFLCVLCVVKCPAMTYPTQKLKIKIYVIILLINVNNGSILIIQ